MLYKSSFFNVLLFFITAFNLIAQSNSEGDLHFDKVALLRHVQALSSDAFEGRRTGTRGAAKAKEYIINQFYSLNVKPFKKSYEQSFFFIKGKKEYRATNVLGYIKGTDKPNKYIVISAHYDHEGIKQGEIYNGADDNASGVSALFAFAEYYKKYPPKHSIILAAFDAEELGLQGSKYFVNSSIFNSKKIRVNVNLDMISRSEKNQLYASGTCHNKSLKYIVSNYKSSKNICVVMGHDGYDGLENWTYSSDHACFHKKDVPFLYFGVEDHEDYHEPTDDYENIHPKFYIEAVRSIVLITNKIDKSGI